MSQPQEDKSAMQTVDSPKRDAFVIVAAVFLVAIGVLAAAAATGVVRIFDIMAWIIPSLGVVIILVVAFDGTYAWLGRRNPQAMRAEQEGVREHEQWLEGREEASAPQKRDVSNLTPRELEVLMLLSSATEKRDVSNLTPRELEILRLLSEGQSNREIAQKLGTSQGWVERRLISVMQALLHSFAYGYREER